MGTNNNTTPTWFIFLTTIAIILGGYYLTLGLRDYIRTGGLGVVEATQQASSRATATAIQAATNAIPTPTLIPSFTPVPDCEDWEVMVPSAIVRGTPNIDGPILEVVEQGSIVCVIRRVPDSDWYLVDVRPATTRIEAGYMRDDIISPLRPTPTPSLSPTPLPTVTPLTPTPTFTPSPSYTPDPNATAPLTPSPPPTTTSTTSPPPVNSI
jgi:hypothetical protein